MSKQLNSFDLPKLYWSLHARQRQQQRGFKPEDETLIQAFGERVEDGYLMSNRSIHAAQRTLKQMLQRIDHLKGATLIESEGTVVTAYRADRRRMRRLRNGHVQAV